jgi:tRNA A-37 threonylcarbamoyl transferase component Bud32
MVNVVNADESKFIYINDIDMSHYLDDIGKFTSSSLAHFLVKMYEHRLIKNSDFQDFKSLKIENIKGCSIAYKLKQLFRITACQRPGCRYIIKELKNNDDAKEFKKGFFVKELEEVCKRLQGVKKHYPKLVFPTFFIVYVHRGTTHILSLMPEAKGVLLQHILEKYCNAPSFENKRFSQKVFRTVGASLAQFHQNFMSEGSLNTLIHGDFHPANIFFDETTGLTSFIDNHYIAKYYRKRFSIFFDFQKICRWTLFIIERSALVKHLKLMFKDCVLRAFFLGYLNEYDLCKQRLILKKLITSVNEKSFYCHQESREEKMRNKTFLKSLSNQLYKVDFAKIR